MISDYKGIMNYFWINLQNEVSKTKGWIGFQEVILMLKQVSFIWCAQIFSGFASPLICQTHYWTLLNMEVFPSW